LIGEETHGTNEFYQIRSEITKRLIEEKQFSFVVFESNFSETKIVRDYVYGLSNHKNAESALKSAYTKFPKWMYT
jgi:erythromycin esterase-like protein